MKFIYVSFSYKKTACGGFYTKIQSVAFIPKDYYNVNLNGREGVLGKHSDIIKPSYELLKL